MYLVDVSAWMVYRKLVINSYYKHMEEADLDEVRFREMHDSLESVAELQNPSEMNK